MTEFNFRDDGEELVLDKSGATHLGRENAAILIPFNAKAYCGMSRHDEQEHNDTWAVHVKWWEQAPYMVRRNDQEFRSYDKDFWLNERCSTAIQRTPDGEDFFLWVAQAQRVGNIDAQIQTRVK